MTSRNVDVKMSHCPNPDCPFVKRHRYAAEYRAGVSTCADCQTALTEGKPEIQRGPPRRWEAKRLWVTLLGVAAARSFHFVIAPGIRSAFYGVSVWTVSGAGLDLGGLGLAPI